MTAIRPITIYKGKIVPLFSDNVNTDRIIPKAYLKRISKGGFGSFAFDEWRYLPDNSDNPGFNPNKPQYKGASILITEDNFGYGLGREHAARIPKGCGFYTITAESFSDIFYMNCTKGAMLPTVLGKSARKYLVQYVRIEVDLPNQTMPSPDKRFHLEVDETWKNKLVNSLDDIAITLQYEPLIEKYEKSL